MELFRRKNSRCWWYDFTVRGERYRGSTKEITKTAAQARAAQILTELSNGNAYRTGRKAPYLSEFGVRFLTFVDNAKLAAKSKEYLRNGWRLLQGTNIPAMRMDHIRTEDVNALVFSGGAYNINCALKTLRRMFNLAREWELIVKIPKIKLAKEIGRSLRLNEEAERKLLPFCGPLYVTSSLCCVIQECAPRKSSFNYGLKIWIGIAESFLFRIARRRLDAVIFP